MEERFFTLRDGHKLFYRTWRPSGDVIATLHLLHGMAEHSLRYNDFALYLNTFGIAVYAQDHRGHGYTKDEDEKGWFSDNDGWEIVCKDSMELDSIIMNEYPSQAHFIMGHSMGSFLTRSIISKYKAGFDGVIIMGTGASKGLIGKIGKLIALHYARKNGTRLANSKLDKLCFGSYNSRVENPKTPFDWLSRDEKEVQKYIDDPLCGFVCSSKFYADLVEGVEVANDVTYMKNIERDTPILIISGSDDPVGPYAKGVERVYESYKKAGLTNVSLKLIDKGRHEILNEIDRLDTYHYISSYLTEIMGRING